MKGRATQKEIARALGLSVQAVSMALRDHREIGAATKARVRAKAEELGYRPDAALSALADYRTKKRRTSARWTRVAVVNNWSTENSLRQDPFYADWLAQLREASALRGIELEEHWLGSECSRAERVFRKLENRGITGVFVAPPAPTLNEPEIPIPRERFQIVTFGPEHLYRDLHTVQFDFYENLRLAWSVLWARGYRRIGLVLRRYQDWRTGHAWRAAYSVEQMRSGGTAKAIEPLLIESLGEDGRGAYCEWLSRHRCDAVISSVRALERWRESLDRPPELALFNVRKRGQQGIDINLRQLVDTAIELLYLEMQRSLVSESGLPFRVHVPGRWVDASESIDV